ncbi:hypothetical protein A2U01_0040823 [Trifolium medium]|uniref:Uncharacterized protein n=1 Tax=Trifolium medium TaxID=97028 RepID=A0A392Q5I6_9FABA|nr:hypothetical protein [Trifolium medium]
MAMPKAIAEAICKWRCQYPMPESINLEVKPEAVGNDEVIGNARKNEPVGSSTGSPVSTFKDL